MPIKSSSTTSFYSNQNSPHELEHSEPKPAYIGHGSEYWKPATSQSQAVTWEHPARLQDLEDTSICYISDIHEPDISTFRFRHPKQVEEIHFDGILSQTNFDRLMQPVANLKILEIHISSLENLNLYRKTGFLFYLPLSKLESLQISSYNFTPNHSAKSKLDRIVSNCCCFIKKSFPSLNFLAVSLPLLRHHETEITDSILKCIKTHYRTLKSLNIESTFDANADSQNGQSIFLNPDHEYPELENVKAIQLHSFHYFSTFNTPSTILWRKFLQTQKKLEYLQFWCGDKFFALPTPLILRNFKTLHTIALNVNKLLSTTRGIMQSAIDCSAFAQCSLLKIFLLKGKPPDPETLKRSKDLQKSADFSNFHLIPKGLEHVRLIHLTLTTQDTHIIAQEMPKLTRLYLEDIGVDDDLGMGIKDLAFLLAKPGKSLLQIGIHNGLNKQSFHEYHPGSGGFAVVAKILFKTHKPDSFTAKLTSEGEYDIAEDGNTDDEEVVEDEILHEDFQEDVEEEQQQLDHGQDDKSVTVLFQNDGKRNETSNQMNIEQNSNNLSRPERIRTKSKSKNTSRK